MWYKEKFFKYSVGILLTILIIYFFGQIDFFLVPFRKFVAILFFPIIIAILFYYLLRPLVHLIEKFKVPRSLAIGIVFVVAILVFAGVSTYAGSIIGKQLNQLIYDFPRILQVFTDKTAEILNNENFQFINTAKIEEQLYSLAEKVGPGILSVLSTLTSVVTVLVVVPFIVFYFLKDDKTFVTRFLKVIPQKRREDTREILIDIDKTLSTYIIGQGIIALVLGTLMYIGYLIIGLKYALILAIFVTFTSFIPLFGSIIGVLPAILVSFADSPYAFIKIIILMIIVQQLEGNLISPQLVGKRLAIHPLTLILLFLVAASLYGFIGMLIAVPTYAVLKVIVSNAVRIYQLQKSDSK